MQYHEYPMQYPEHPVEPVAGACAARRTSTRTTRTTRRSRARSRRVGPSETTETTRRLLRLPTDGRGPAAPCRTAERAGGRGGMRRRRSLRRAGGGGPPRWTRLHASVSGEATLRNEGTALLCANPRACPRSMALVPTASSVPGPHAAPHILDRNPPAPAPNSAGVLDSTALSIGPLPRLMHVSIVDGRSRPFGSWNRQSADLGHRSATATERWPT